ncbi:Integrase (fragment) [Rhodospirillaceae bacterium LM-1]
MFTGARLNEIGQLEVADIILHNGVHHFNITNESDDPKANKKVKTAAARRKVPIHPKLEELGFFDYVESISQKNGKRLFPEWQVGKDGFYSSPMSKWFARLLSETGIKSSKLAFHSLRHNFKDILRQNNIPEMVQDYVMGHANETVQKRYGSTGLLPNETAALRAINYDHIDLSHPRRKEPG